MQQSANPGEMISDVTAIAAGTASPELNGAGFNGTGRPGGDEPSTREVSTAEGSTAEVSTAEVSTGYLGGDVLEATITRDATPDGTAPIDRDSNAEPDGAPDTAGASLGYRGVTATAAAGITYRQLDYWARTGLVVPSVRDASGSGTQRLYSFRDIVVLKVVKRLLDAGVSLQNIRKAIETLRRWGEDDLATMTLISDGTTVYECRSAEEVVDLLQGGQGVFGIAIGGAFKEIQGSLAELPHADANVEAEPTGDTASAMDELAARRARRRAG